MIYLTLSHSLKVFPSCYAVSTFSATPNWYYDEGGKFMSSETTDVDRPLYPLKTFALPVSASSPGKKKERKNTKSGL